MNIQIVLNTPKTLLLNEAAQKILAEIFLPKQIPKLKISNPDILRSSLSLEIWSTPSGTTTTMPIKYPINKV